MTRKLDNEDFIFLQANARVGIAQGLSHFLHLDQPIGLWNYIRIANAVASAAGHGAQILDWGCGMGQMTYLMQRRSLSVTSYDVREAGDRLPNTPLSNTFERITSQEPTHLPFDSRRFDAVLSCGVLEHVDEYSQPGNERISLQEIARVLKPGGKFLIYQLPQRHAWQEAVIRRTKAGYAHPRRYTASELDQLLAGAGLTRTHLRRANLIPKNLTGMPGALRTAYSAISHPLIAVDGIASQLPLLKNLAGVLEVIATRKA